MTASLRLSACVRAGLLLVLGAGAAALSSCGTLKPASAGSEYVVIAPRTGFYRFGPNQNRGPDAMLELGERVTLVSREYGFSRFRIKDGTTGYALWNDFAPAPPAPKPLPTPPKRLASGGAKTRRGPAPVPTNDPLFDIRDVPLPDLPEHDAKPNFRAR